MSTSDEFSNFMFNHHFYTSKLPRPLAEIDADLKKAEAEVVWLMAEVIAQADHP